MIKGGQLRDLLKQRSPTFLASGTGFLKDNFLKDPGVGLWFQDDSSSLHLVCTLFLLLLHELHLGSSAIRSRIFGTLALKLWGPSFIHLYLLDANYVPGTGPCIRWRIKLKHGPSSYGANNRGEDRRQWKTRVGISTWGIVDPSGKEVHGAGRWEAPWGEEEDQGLASGDNVRPWLRLPAEAVA